MQVIKAINNNAAIAKDSSGIEVVILGKGVGFPKTPYELKDLSKIERTFYDTDSKYFSMVASLSQEILLASSDIVQQAEINLDCELNTNLPFTLGDHLQFAIERFSKNIDIVTPIAYDVKHLYPLEYELGALGLDIVEDYTKIRLPDNEAVNIALHLITARSEVGELNNIIQSVEIISNIRKIIESELQLKIDEETYNYSRFTMHICYLIQRLREQNKANIQEPKMLGMMRLQYPVEYKICLDIVKYFENQWSWICSEEEKLYLLIHIIRLSQNN